jgi:succinoglycan biosynthesis transport protein ExoP
MKEAEQKPAASEFRTLVPRPIMAGRGPAPGMTPKEILAILRRHWLMIIALTILGLISGGGSWYLLNRYLPKYTAMTFIRVLPPVEKDPTSVQAPIVANDIQYGHRMSMAALLQSQGMLQQLIDRDKIQETKWFKGFGPIKDVRIRKAIKDLKKNLGASPQREGDSIIVSMTCGNKTESALIVNEMVSLFISSQGGSSRKDVAEKLSQLEKQQDRVQRDLDTSERTLDDIRRRFGFADLEEHNFEPIIDRKLADLENQQNELMMNISQIRAGLERLAIQAEGPVQVQTERQVETDPVMTSLAQQLAFQESGLASALSKFGEDHRLVRQIREYIASIEQERLQRKAAIAEQTRQANLRDAQDTLITMEKRLDELEKMREEASKRKDEMDLARAQYKKQIAIRNERRMMLDEIKSQAEKLKIMFDDPETPKVQFVANAPEPLEASFPKLQIFAPGGIMLGLLAGVGLAFLVELLNDRVRTPKDVTAHLHIPLLGLIPDAEEDDDLEEIELAFVVREAPGSIISESYRRLRTNLKVSLQAQNAKTILITSGGAGDGKTAVAVNLATTLVAEGKKVLLIDGNFRRPALQKIFTSKQDSVTNTGKGVLGLSCLLAGQCGLKDVIKSSGMEWLKIIESGQMPANPAELLGGDAMQRLVKQERDNYDYIIIDGPPVLLVSEAKILARHVDGTIIVFNAAATRRGAAIRTVSELKQVNAGIFGCVLLGVKTLKGGYFRESFRSYQEYQVLEPAKA